LIFLLHSKVSAQHTAEYFRGPQPKQESRIFGSSGDFRKKEYESIEPRYPEPFRFLIVGDDHAQGCGWKSFPPSYSFDNCTEFDEGFRIELVSKIRERTGIEIETVGSFQHPKSIAATSSLHEARPGLRIDEISSAVNWQLHKPDLLLLYAGTTDILQLDSAKTMIYRYDNLLTEIRSKLPNIRVVVSSILDIGGPFSTPEMRHNIHEFNRRLSDIINQHRNKMMEVRFIDLGKLLYKVCAPGSSQLLSTSNVPACSINEINPTVYGYSLMASHLSEAFDELLLLDGTCRGRPKCDETELRLWRNRIDGGLRVVASYQS
jgi:hypothetical protein